MVNMPFCDEAVELSKEHGFTDCVGLHLNISEGYPLSDQIKSCPKFVGKDGKFKRFFQKHIYNKLFLSRYEQQAVSKEFEAQISKYHSFGFHAHIDSHHHLHTILPIANVLIACLKKHDFTTLRCMKNLEPNRNCFLKLRCDIYNLMLERRAKVLIKHFAWFDHALMTDLPKDCVIELMCHPDYDTEGNLINKDNPVDFIELYKNIGDYKLVMLSEI
jgi:hypothetical protein